MHPDHLDADIAVLPARVSVLRDYQSKIRDFGAGRDADQQMIALDPHVVARALGGNVSGHNVVAPGPGHSRADRSLSVKLDPSAPDGFIVHSFAGDSVG